jgi:hypothetical protein
MVLKPSDSSTVLSPSAIAIFFKAIDIRSKKIQNRLKTYALNGLFLLYWFSFWIFETASL